MDGTPWQWIVPLNTIFIFATAVATWLYSRGGKEALLREQVRAAQEALNVANLRAEKSELANDALLERLNTHMLQDASAFAELKALASETSRSAIASETRLTNALDNLSKRIDGMAERVDTFLNMAFKHPA